MNQSSTTANREIYFDEDEINLLLNKALMGLPWSSWLKWHSLSPFDNQGIQRRVLSRMLREKSEQYQRFLHREQEQDDQAQRTTPTTITTHNSALYPQDNEPASQEDIRVLNRLRTCTMVPLRELEIDGESDYDRRVAPLLPFLSSLTFLRIHLADRFDMQLDSLFEALPWLERLDLRNIETIIVSATISTTPGQGQGQEQAPSARILPHLRSLILEHSRVHQLELEGFLTRAPRLQELKLIDLLSKSRTFYRKEPFHYDAPRLLRHLQDLDLPLQTLHFSIYDTEIPDELQVELDKLVAPWTRNLTAQELFPSRIRLMNQLQNTITTLDLYGSKMCWKDDVLHQYLCSSPYLLHLRAPDTIYLVNHFDLHRRLESTQSSFLANTTGNSPCQPEIWKCRKLRTLHMGFHTLDQDMYAFSTPQHAQIRFGYISLVCPHLEDLFIHGTEELETSEMSPGAEPEPGLLLLTRLRFLRALKVGRTSRRMLRYNSRRPQACRMPEGDEEGGVMKEFKWMVPAGHMEAVRLARRKGIDGWERAMQLGRFIELQLQLDNERNNNNHPNSSNDQAVGTKPGSGNRGDEDEADAKLKEALKDLGRDTDVKKTIDEMDAIEGYVCWPDIRRVAIFSMDPFGLPVEREYQRIISRS
ncbi:hypothetical protein BGZ47_005978 [Haplosporangium gracile]|nr:hypothetical protein BGZ47_005978 [Haplosporangium gracile]